MVNRYQSPFLIFSYHFPPVCKESHMFFSVALILRKTSYFVLAPMVFARIVYSLIASFDLTCMPFETTNSWKGVSINSLINIIVSFRGC